MNRGTSIELTRRYSFSLFHSRPCASASLVFQCQSRSLSRTEIQLSHFFSFCSLLAYTSYHIEGFISPRKQILRFPRAGKHPRIRLNEDSAVAPFYLAITYVTPENFTVIFADPRHEFIRRSFLPPIVSLLFHSIINVATHNSLSLCLSSRCVRVDGVAHRVERNPPSLPLNIHVCTNRKTTIQPPSPPRMLRHGCC